VFCIKISGAQIYLTRGKINFISSEGQIPKKMTSRILSEHFFFSTSPRRRLVTKTRPTLFTGPSSSSSYSPPELSLISEILDGKLYLSGCEAVTTSNLMSRGITAIVCAMTDWEERRTNVNDRTPTTIKKFRVPITDSEMSDIGNYFDAVTRFIDDELTNGGRVLVHCVAGVSRSTTLVLAYLVRFRGYTLLDSFDFVAEKRRIAWPNDGFYRQLIGYERKLRLMDHDKNNTPATSTSTNTSTSSTSTIKPYTFIRARSPAGIGYRSLLP